MVVVSGMCDIYYIVIIAWSFFYLFASFTEDLPWTHCGEDHNSPSNAPSLFRNV